MGLAAFMHVLDPRQSAVEYNGSDYGDGPNAKGDKHDGSGFNFARIGDVLEVNYRATKGKGWYDFSPTGMSIKLNGQPLRFCQGLTIELIGPDIAPKATIVVTLEELVMDIDTLVALGAIVTRKEVASDTEDSGSEAEGS